MVVKVNQKKYQDPLVYGQSAAVILQISQSRGRRK